jgi:uncharacterized protein (DUF1330 family)
MNKGYWIALYKKIKNTTNLSDYAKKATETIIKHGGKPLVRGGKYDVLEGDNFSRTVIWEFPSYEAAQKCYNSSDYQSAWSLAKKTTERNLQVVEGFNTE